MTASRLPDGTVLVEYEKAKVAVKAGDHFVFRWGGPYHAAVGSTPFELSHQAKDAVSTELYSTMLMDEHGNYLEILNGLRKFLADLGAVVDVTVTETCFGSDD